uniref:IQ motif and ubiquitin-like domain-containing protein n=1 Tax=Graphocephala atropunctata TaxID=36148 RepID=A0A1B6LM96_9HEMI
MTDTIIVKFTLDPSKEFSSRFRKNITIKEIRERLADVLEVKLEMIKLKNETGNLKDSLVLGDLSVTNTKVRIVVESKSIETTIIEKQVSKNIPTLDVITCHLSDNTEFLKKHVIVEIENKSCQKEWLGGYRHKLTGVEYHHADTQTKPRMRQVCNYSHFNYKIPLLFHRDTQTPYPLKHVTVSTVVSRGTQMPRNDIYISPSADKILTARPYQPFLSEPTFVKKVTIIQKTFRCLARKRKFLEIVKQERKRIEELKKQKLQIVINQALKERNILTNVVYPTTRGDFYQLYLMIGKWLKNEWDRISNLRTSPARKAKRCRLLEKEVSFLFDVEKHRISMKKEALKKEEMRFLEMSARPYTFKNSKGQITSVDDLNTQRARELKEVYSQLIKTDTMPSDRVDFLFTFKQLFTSKFTSYEFFSDLIALIDREIDLISIGMGEKDLKGVRARIEQLYLHFCHQTEFNAKAEKYRKPNLPKTVDALYLCNRCKKLLPPSKFPVHIRMRSYTKCKSCDWLHNIALDRADLSPFLKLLRKVQHKEMSQCCRTSVCFLLQQIGMGFLTNVIWHGQSAVSACQDLSRLQHVRWKTEVEWSPWNTILLTDQEAKCHESIANISAYYSKSFVGKIHRRHINARTHFDDLVKMDQDLRSSGAWQNIKDSGPYFHRSHADAFASQNEYDKF